MLWLKRFLTEQSPVLSLVFWIFLTLVSVLAYGIIHSSLNKDYKKSVSPLIKQSVAGFNIGSLDQEGFWVLSLDGQNLSSPTPEAVLNNAPFSVGSFASFRGKINQTQAQLNNFNQIVQSNFQSLLEQSNNQNTTNQTLIPLSSLGVKSITANAFLGIPSSAFQQFTQAPSIGNLSRFVHYLEHSQIYQFHNHSEVPQPSGLQANGITPIAFRVDQILAVSRSIPENLVLFEPLPSASTLTARQEALTALKNIWHPAALSIFDLNFPQPQSDLPNLTPFESPEQLQVALNQSLQANLVSTIDAETSFFFLIGNFRWLDIAFFAIFGVIIQANIRLIRLNSDLRKYWKGNFIILALAKLVYSPLLVIIVFFLIDLISSPEISLQFTNSSLAQLGIAALLGMHPHTAYRLIRRGLKSILAEEITAPKIDPIHEKKSRLIQSPRPKTVAQLKSNILAIADNTITR